LLGLYCLENIDKVQTFWKVYWDILRSARENLDNNEKNELLVAIKATTDFIVKFNSLSREDFHPLEIEDFNSDIFMSVMIKLILHQDAEVRILSIESLCRMIYHERVDESNLFSYFIYLVLLWLEVSTEEITSRSVHTVSIFMKSYIEKGNNWAKKLTEVFCIFFKLILKFQEEGKAINRSIIRYNLTTE
jgi:predicted DNA-binding ribbon-helix-helix protein